MAHKSISHLSPPNFMVPNHTIQIRGEVSPYTQYKKFIFKQYFISFTYLYVVLMNNCIFFHKYNITRKCKIQKAPCDRLEKPFLFFLSIKGKNKSKYKYTSQPVCFIFQEVLGLLAKFISISKCQPNINISSTSESVHHSSDIIQLLLVSIRQLLNIGLKLQIAQHVFLQKVFVLEQFQNLFTMPNLHAHARFPKILCISIAFQVFQPRK